jgi:hypothetical protein
LSVASLPQNDNKRSGGAIRAKNLIYLYDLEIINYFINRSGISRQFPAGVPVDSRWRPGLVAVAAPEAELIFSLPRLKLP